jgi:hypothetical protein
MAVSGRAGRFRVAGSDSDGAPSEGIAGDGEPRPGIGAGEFDRCERPLAGETLRSASELTDSMASGPREPQRVRPPPGAIRAGGSDNSY